MKPLGAVACGHPLTAKAAESILQSGGNAFDAIIAAHFMACVAEPVLASPAGGGFLLAKPAGKDTLVYDFFAHTPKQRKNPAELDFFPITADFGTASQEFHTGLGSVATPGSVHGLFQVHQELGKMPLPLVMEPAIKAAREGVTSNQLQSYILHVVQPIYRLSADVHAVFRSKLNPSLLITEGEKLRQPDLADSLEALAREGADLFYQGEIGQRLLEQMKEGGQLNTQDLSDYRTIKRKPLSLDFKGARLLINPPPSAGGLLIGFALKLLQSGSHQDSSPGSLECSSRLLQIMDLASQARLDADNNVRDILDQGYLDTYRQKVRAEPRFNRGTTHMSVADADNNIASLTVSNGEGCGHFIPGTGIMSNNMLGEEDLSPHGFHQWRTNTRMSSMMAPSILQLNNGSTIALGSGGSNRIRSAILQVILNLLEHRMPLQEAVDHPRMHLENNLLSIEPGLDGQVIKALAQTYPKQKCWTDKNLFFGGVHAVQHHNGKFTGAGDGRRGGIALVL